MSGSVKDTPVTEISILDETREKLVAERETYREQHEAFLRIDKMLNQWDRLSATGGAPRAERGARKEAFLAVITEAGDKGITVAEAAADSRLEGTNKNYLYRLAGDLTGSGEIRKDEATKRYFLVA